MRADKTYTVGGGDARDPTGGDTSLTDPDLMGYGYNVEIRGVGTMVWDVEISKSSTGGFTLLQPGDQFFTGQVIVIHFLSNPYDPIQTGTMLLPLSFFKMNIHIGQIDNLAIQEVLSDYSERYQKEFLSELFGEDLANEYISDYDDTGNPDMMALDAILVDRVLEISPIANYIYCKYLEYTNTINQGIGTVKPGAENSTVVVNAEKIVKAWNLMIDMICPMHAKIKALSMEDYKYKSYTDICGNVCGCGNVLPFHKINRFGI